MAGRSDVGNDSGTCSHGIAKVEDVDDRDVRVKLVGISVVGSDTADGIAEGVSGGSNASVDVGLILRGAISDVIEKGEGAPVTSAGLEDIFNDSDGTDVGFGWSVLRNSCGLTDGRDFVRGMVEVAGGRAGRGLFGAGVSGIGASDASRLGRGEMSCPAGGMYFFPRSRHQFE